MTFRVRVEEMIGARIVLVHTFFYQPQTEHARVEIKIFLRWTSDRRDVMKSPNVLHNLSVDNAATPRRALLQMISFNEGDTGRATHAANDRRVISRS